MPAVDRNESKSNEGSNGSAPHSALTSIASTVSEADVESSLEDFIARANSTLQEFGGWNSEADQAAQVAADQRAAEEAALRDMESVNAQVMGELKALESKSSTELRDTILRAEKAETAAAELETRLADAQSVEYAELEAKLADAEARAKKAEARAKKAALTAAATAIDEPHSEPESERKLPLGLIIGAFAIGLVIMFGISQVIGGGSKDESKAVVAKPDPTPVAAPIVQPPPPAPVEPALAPAPVVAEPEVKPDDSQPVEPEPVVEPVAVAVKKPATKKKTTRKPATKKPATSSSGIVDPFATKKPTTKKKTTRKRPTKKKTTKKKSSGGIVDPFAQ